MKLYTTLEQELKKEPNFVTDNGELKKWVVINKAQNFDEELIGLMLDNADLKDKFFVKVKGTLIFNQNLFVQFLEQKNYLNDSYTQYKNKVGLRLALDMLFEAAWTDVFGYPTLIISKSIRFCASCMEQIYSPSACWNELEENENDRKQLRCG